MAEYEYIIVLLDNCATSFCHYDNPSYSAGDGRLISLHMLKSIVEYANNDGISINYLHPRKILPEAYTEIIESTEHINILPIELRNQYDKAICVVNPDSIDQIESVPQDANMNMILRLPRQNIGDLSDISALLISRCQRLNLILLDIEKYGQENLDIYAQQLEVIQTNVAELYRSGRMVEMNFVSDRILLTEMNNCDAGVRHVTFAPNGKFYLCPAFYYHNPEDSIGDLDDGIDNNNEQLLRIDHAPLCRNCDAFHCKRCVFLNRLTTNELNTPSHEQCVISHLERNVSKYILEELQPSIKEFAKHEDIPYLDYLDPIDFVMQMAKEPTNEKHKEKAMNEGSKTLAKMTDREVLNSIYKMQKEILKILSQKSSKGASDG